MFYIRKSGPVGKMVLLNVRGQPYIIIPYIILTNPPDFTIENQLYGVEDDNFKPIPFYIKTKLTKIEFKYEICLRGNLNV